MNSNWEFDYQSPYQNSNTNNYQNGYDTPNVPPVEVPKKRGTGKKIVAVLCVCVMCFGISVGGGYLGNKLAGGSGTVIYKSVTEGKNTASAPSAGNGDALSVSQISSLAGPSVVEVMTEQVQMDSFFGQRVLSGAGSGVIISEDGYIITNQHVVENTNKLTVTLSDKKEYEATVIGKDSKTDIAIIKIDAKGLTSAVIGDSDKLVVGEFALAIGNPMGTLGGTVTDGIISALNRDIVVGTQTMTLLQTSAAISPGNSGGGLFNEYGELVGIVNAKSSEEYTEGLGFAIPINAAMKVATELMSNGYVSGRPALGVKIIAITDLNLAMQYGVDNLGVYVTEITQNGAAEKAGLKAGDRFISVDGAAVSTTTDITDAIGKLTVGDKIDVQVAREGRVVSVELELGEMQAE